jgi:carbon-monoxide dehydrogenase medium subunit
MKPAAFDYHAPTTLEEAAAVLSQSGEDARVLAGGQSLVPAMAFRLARPSVLVDINRIESLSGVRRDGDRLVIGATTRHKVFEGIVTEGPLGRLLTNVVHNIAHLPIRTRGTFGGSLAHADPSSEWCALVTALDGEIVATSTAGRRTIPAADFFKTVFTTALRPDEILTEIRLPVLDGAWRCGFVEFNLRAGDFAIVSATAGLRIENGRIGAAFVAVGGAIDRPVRSPAAEKVLVGEAPGDAVFRAAAEAARASIEPTGDLHADPEYKSELVAAMTRRALERAVAA